MRYCFHHFASGKTSEITEDQAAWMAGKAWGIRESIKRLDGLKPGEYLSVTGGRISLYEGSPMATVETEQDKNSTLKTS